jgi:hypothetical protein
VDHGLRYWRRRKLLRARLRSTASILLNEEGAFDGDGVKAHLAHDTEKKVLALRRGGWR